MPTLLTSDGMAWLLSTPPDTPGHPSREVFQKCQEAGATAEYTIDVLRRAPGVQLVALFGPEHGIYGDVPAGDKVESRTDPRTGLTVHSLYGATRKPTPAMLQGLDALVYDLQDTGCRSYTFISTMGLAMEACGGAHHWV